MTEEEIKFDKRPIPEIQRDAIGQKEIENNKRTSYGNKYQLNRNTISIVDTLFESLENVQSRKEHKTKGETIGYLIDLEEELLKRGWMHDTYKCKKCGKQIEVDSRWNLDTLFHRDIDNTPECKFCNGRIRKSYGLIEKLPDANEQKEQEIEQEIEPIEETKLERKMREASEIAARYYDEKAP